MMIAPVRCSNSLTISGACGFKPSGSWMQTIFACSALIFASTLSSSKSYFLSIAAISSSVFLMFSYRNV